ncbi:MAG TPA: shikimate dehydrogenase [Caulobacteraceae bacterium]
MRLSASTRVAGVAGLPIGHSLSPTLHNAWIEAAGLDAVYVAFEPKDFRVFAAGCRGGVIRGLNVTAPFKGQALELADDVSPQSARAEAANILIFESGGEIRADNTDGEGLLAALAEQAGGFDPAVGPAVILGAGGAARGAAAALMDAGTPRVCVVNRSAERARALANSLSGPLEILEMDALPEVLAGANVVINATSADPKIPFEFAADSTVVMDMVYLPLTTPFLARAKARGLRTVDGLAMLIGQARPSFEALFGVAAPDVDVRSLAVEVLEGRR